MQSKIAYALATIFVLIFLGTVYFNEAEEWSYVDSFYFSTMTLTTIGYGDITPTQNATKIFVSIYAIFGIAVMLYVLGSIIGKSLVEQEQVFHRLFTRIYNLRHKKIEEKTSKSFNKKKDISEKGR